ncbi:Putative esterase [Sporomusa carbonis]|uniref:hotdog fold thioesterase n=1 Tax=Sporomusa carbonis TaxID=3076075 RepID=UPI003A611DD8
MTGEQGVFKDTLLEALGIKIVELSEERAVATMPVNHATRQPHGLLHGGASVALAETVASMGTYNLVDKTTKYVVGIEINANHIRSKSDGVVTAVGIPIHKGKTTMVWEIKITDENGTLICASRCTVGIFPKSI